MSKKKKRDLKKQESIHDILAKKAARITLDQTHTRRTFHAEDKLWSILDELEADSLARGFKKEFLNNAIRKSLREDYGIDV